MNDTKKCYFVFTHLKENITALKKIAQSVYHRLMDDDALPLSACIYEFILAN